MQVDYLTPCANHVPVRPVDNVIWIVFLLHGSVFELSAANLGQARQLEF